MDVIEHVIASSNVYEHAESTTGNPYMCLCYVCVYIHAELALNQNNMGADFRKGSNKFRRGSKKFRRGSKKFRRGSRNFKFTCSLQTT